MRKKHALTIAQLRGLDQIRRGNPLCRWFDEENHIFYFYAHGGRAPNCKTVRILEDRGLIVPAADGLFGEHQSYTVAA